MLSNLTIGLAFVAAGWLIPGLVAKGILRGNNLDIYNILNMKCREDQIAAYWMLSSERWALFGGPISLLYLIWQSHRYQTWDLKLFSLRSHNLGVRLGWRPVHYHGRLVSTNRGEQKRVLRSVQEN